MQLNSCPPSSIKRYQIETTPINNPISNNSKADEPKSASINPFGNLSNLNFINPSTPFFIK